jgi:hypothetical protein
MRLCGFTGSIGFMLSMFALLRCSTGAGFLVEVHVIVLNGLHCPGFSPKGVPRSGARWQVRMMGTTLFQDLKDWRKRTAEELQQPVFQILNNKLIEAIAVQRPANLVGLAELSGIGPKKLKKYGRTILNLVQNHQEDGEHLTLEDISERNRASDASFWAAYEKPKPKKKRVKPEDAEKAEARRKKRIELLSDMSNMELRWPEIQKSDLNAEQQSAADHILAGHNVFLTGSAGTGKTFLLRYVIQEMEKLHGGKGEVAVTAPTGIAAINIGGQTIHSFAGIGLGTK